MDTIILACNSLKDYIEDAQRTQKTTIPVIYLDRKYHIDPKQMKQCIIEEEQKLPETIDTILVAMGFCGGSWEGFSCSKKIVIPRVDDCISLVLQKTDKYISNLKQMGHLYMIEKNPDDFDFEKMFCNQPEEIYEGISQDELLHLYFDHYKWLDIVDTGLTDCYSEEYVTKVQKNADLINATLDYVEGGNYLLEKLVSGRWDEQFLVAQPGHLIKHGDFFE